MRRNLLFGLLLGMILLSVPASASDTFGDVVSGNVHHDAVREMAASGITLGCATGEYCPAQSVRRDQMASFLARGLSRSGFNEGPTDLVAVEDGLAGVPASTTVRTSGGDGGRSTVMLQGTVTVFSDDAQIDEACPCEVEAFIYREGGGQGPSSWAQLPGEPTSSGRVNVALPVSWGLDLPSERDATFQVAVFVNGAEPQDTSAEGSLSALTAPFGDAPRD